MEQSEIEILVGELETRVERLRSLYDQYFMGIEKLEPAVVRKDVDRRFYVLRKLQIRNTALRFRFQTVVQRYNTYQSYWVRICRQIEEGTYKRDLRRAAARFGTATKHAPIEVDFDETQFGTEAPIDDGAANGANALSSPRPPAPSSPAQSPSSPAAASPSSPASPQSRPSLVPNSGRGPSSMRGPTSTRPSVAPPEARPRIVKRSEKPDPDTEPKIPVASPNAATLDPFDIPITSAGPPSAPTPSARGPASSDRASATGDRASGVPSERGSAPGERTSTGAIPVARRPSIRPSMTPGDGVPSARSSSSMTPGEGVPSARSPAAPPPFRRPSITPSGGARSVGAGAQAAPPSQSQGRSRAPGVKPGSGRSAPADTDGAPPSNAAPLPPVPRAPAAPHFSQRPGPSSSKPPAHAPPPAPPPPRSPPSSMTPRSQRTPIATARPSSTPGAAADLSDQRVRELYSEYVESKRARQESTATITYDTVAKSLRESRERLRQKHGEKAIDFEVTVKDGQTILRPIIR